MNVRSGVFWKTASWVGVLLHGAASGIRTPLVLHCNLFCLVFEKSLVLPRLASNSL